MSKRFLRRPTWQARLLNAIDPRTDLVIAAIVVLILAASCGK